MTHPDPRPVGMTKLWTANAPWRTPRHLTAGVPHNATCPQLAHASLLTRRSMATAPRRANEPNERPFAAAATPDCDGSRLPAGPARSTH